MSKGNIAREMENEMGVSVAGARKYMDAFLKSDVRACADNESVRLADFGTFTVRVMAERKGRKPQTGEIMNLPSRRAVRFIPASDFDRKLKGK